MVQWPRHAEGVLQEEGFDEPLSHTDSLCLQNGGQYGKVLGHASSLSQAQLSGRAGPRQTSRLAEVRLAKAKANNIDKLKQNR